MQGRCSSTTDTAVRVKKRRDGQEGQGCDDVKDEMRRCSSGVRKKLKKTNLVALVLGWVGGTEFEQLQFGQFD